MIGVCFVAGNGTVSQWAVTESRILVGQNCSWLVNEMETNLSLRTTHTKHTATKTETWDSITDKV